MSIPHVGHRLCFAMDHPSELELGEGFGLDAWNDASGIPEAMVEDQPIMLEVQLPIHREIASALAECRVVLEDDALGIAFHASYRGASDEPTTEPVMLWVRCESPALAGGEYRLEVDGFPWPGRILVPSEPNHFCWDEPAEE